MPHERLHDILEYGTYAVGQAAHGAQRLEADLTLRLAFERALFLVGEAAAALPSATRQAIDQPWHDIIGLRNVLAHQYEGLELALLVNHAKRHLPPLLAAVQEHLDG